MAIGHGSFSEVQSLLFRNFLNDKYKFKRPMNKQTMLLSMVTLI